MCTKRKFLSGKNSLCKYTIENTYLTETKKTMYGAIVFLPFILEMWPKRWVNAEGELQGQSCPRQTAGHPEVFLRVFFQIHVYFEAELMSECVLPCVFFTDRQKHMSTKCYSCRIWFWSMRGQFHFIYSGLLYTVTKHLSSLPHPFLLLQSEGISCGGNIDNSALDAVLTLSQCGGERGECSFNAFSDS